MVVDILSSQNIPKLYHTFNFDLSADGQTHIFTGLNKSDGIIISLKIFKCLKFHYEGKLKDHFLLFSIGTGIIRYNLLTNEQHLILNYQKVYTFEMMKVFNSSLLIVLEKSQKRQKISICDPLLFDPTLEGDSLNQKDGGAGVRSDVNVNNIVLSSLKFEEKQVLDFSALRTRSNDTNSRLIAVLIRGDLNKFDYSVEIWNWYTRRLEGTISLQVKSEISIPKCLSFISNEEISVAGNLFFKNISISNGTFKQDSTIKASKYNFTKIIAFGENKIVGLTADSILVVLEKARVKLECKNLNIE